MILAVTTGMRRGEILGLQWSDIDLDADGGALLVVNRTVQRVDGQLVADEPKSSASRRTIVLGSEAAQALRRPGRITNLSPLPAADPPRDNGRVRDCR